jgi:DNA-binding transcriptional LysR family regulator
VNNRVVDLVEEGIDVALRVRPTLEDSGSLIVKNLGITQGLLVATPALLERYGRPESVDDLGQLPTLAMSAIDSKTTWTLIGPGGKEHEFQHRPVYTADDLLTLKYAVGQNAGMSILPDYMCTRDLERGDLEHVLPDWGPRPGVIHAVFPSRRGLTPAVRRFLDYLGENVAGEGKALECP